ncbi:MAG: hypothetical protein IT440_06640 [Phycisphaeraceae bacterium]|nr:hypothetical protein [Phycisphaeraceae bacterium]
MPGPKYLHYEANAGHSAGTGGAATARAFFRAVMDKQSLPELTWLWTEDGHLQVRWIGSAGQAIWWQAQSDTRDFRQARWTSTPLEGRNAVEATLTAPKRGWAAGYVEVQFAGVGQGTYGLCTEIVVQPVRMPYDSQGRATKKP